MISPFYQSRKSALKIHIFKTNIRTEQDIFIIRQILNSNPNIITWSVDMEDIDKVLRIESHKDFNEEEIITMVKLRGLYCEELE
tara:strand:- start:1207 stop:1458 length:252 start_codon:yes stop_codon:yes gene_type:complete